MFASRRSSALAITLLLASIPVHDVAAAQPAAGAEWTTPAGTVEGTRFSSLDQINAANVNRLTEEFRFSTRIVAGHEGQPLVVDGIMYMVSPFPNKLFALDLARRGEVLWVFDPRGDLFAQDKACCDIVNRGAAFHPRNPQNAASVDKIIYNVLDTTTVAVNAKTGKEVWRTKLGDPKRGETITMAPLVAKNKVFVGNSGGELGVRGFIAALDAETGKELWRAWSTGPDADVRIVRPFFVPPYPKDAPPDLGTTTWPGELWRQGGSTVWAWVTYDPVLDLLFHGTANPGVWNPDMREGGPGGDSNHWSTSVFARNPDTGNAKWAYQMTPHDGWDYDGVNENIVADVDGQQLLVRFDRNGFAYTHDRATGRIINANKYVFANWAERIDLATGLPVENPEKRTREGVNVKDICPASPGGKDQQPAAFSPRTKLFYAPTNNMCMDYEALKALYMAGTPFVGASVTMKAGPNDQGQFGSRKCGSSGAQPCGEFIAWDAIAGRKIWGIEERFPVWSGVLATAGDVVFYGTLDRNFKAVNAKTGQVLFQTRLPSGIVGNPMTFLGTDGKQRIAIFSGVGGWAGAIVPHEFSEDDPFAALGAVGAMARLPDFTGPGFFVHVFKIQ